MRPEARAAELRWRRDAIDAEFVRGHMLEPFDVAPRIAPIMRSRCARSQSAVSAAARPAGVTVFGGLTRPAASMTSPGAYIHPTRNLAGP